MDSSNRPMAPGTSTGRRSCQFGRANPMIPQRPPTNRMPNMGTGTAEHVDIQHCSVGGTARTSPTALARLGGVAKVIGNPV